MLLYDAISRVAKALKGAYAICADAIDEAATVFYLKHQFQPLVSRAQTLFLPMKTAQPWSAAMALGPGAIDVEQRVGLNGKPGI